MEDFIFFRAHCDRRCGGHRDGIPDSHAGLPSFQTSTVQVYTH